MDFLNMPLPPSSVAVIDPSAHKELAERNEDIANALYLLDGKSDWVIVLCFYSALHYIYSILPIPEILTTHNGLNRAITTHCSRPCYVAYSWLSDQSRNARYYPVYSKRYMNKQKKAESALDKLDELKKELGIS
jgi:hypothetical protein